MSQVLSSVLACLLVVGSACSGAGDEDVGAGMAALSDRARARADLFDSLSAEERAGIADANSRPTAIERLRARQEFAQEIVARRGSADRPAGDTAVLRSYVVEDCAPEGDDALLHEAYEATLRGFAPTPADIALDERIEAEIAEMERTRDTVVGPRGRPGVMP